MALGDTVGGGTKTMDRPSGFDRGVLNDGGAKTRALLAFKEAQEAQAEEDQSGGFLGDAIAYAKENPWYVGGAAALAALAFWR